ncbi:unnamed protein product [Paramecium sonneborni]|uniref:Transmembrane protein n=1 Tax=Paramecium sonneborni TaxID=65129 RepID=A0A8S1R614_9CILI|nr:unnamed protein product [Paramecium sonneborni]
MVYKYVKDKIARIKQGIHKKMNNLMLHDYVTYPLKAQDYFIWLSNPDEALRQLYFIVLCCLQGQVQQRYLEQIKRIKQIHFRSKIFIFLIFPYVVLFKSQKQNNKYYQPLLMHSKRKQKRQFQIQIRFKQILKNQKYQLIQINYNLSILVFQNATSPICKGKWDEIISIISINVYMDIKQEELLES